MDDTQKTQTQEEPVVQPEEAGYTASNETLKENTPNTSPSPEETGNEPEQEKKEDLPTGRQENQRDIPVNAKWYVIHTYSGHENKVSNTLKQRIETMKLKDQIFDIVVPTRNVVTVRHGKKEEQKEKIFPGYILVRMVLNDMSWFAVRTTQGVTAFVGAGDKPTPISESEVKAIMKFMEMEAPKYKTTFSVNEAVKITDGPFADFLGTIDSIDEEKGKLKVLVSIFGRETPVELDFLQVAKL